MILCVQKAIRILSVISDSKNIPVSLGAIARATSYPKPTCAHILETLCAEGAVERVSHTEGYRLGLTVYNLVRYGRYEEELVALCRPVLKWIERTTHCSPLLAVIRNHQKFIIDLYDDEQHVFPEWMQVRQDDLYRTATGRAIMAHMDKDEIWEIYRRYGQPLPGEWDVVTSYETLLDELARLRHAEIIDVEIKLNDAPHMVGYASPIFRNGECVGALGLSWRVTAEQEPLFRDHAMILQRTLLKAVNEIHRRLSYDVD